MAALDDELGCVRSEDLGRARRMADSQGRYIEFCKSTVPQTLDMRGLKLVVDAAHGAAYSIAPHVFREVGAEVHAIGVSPDGFNINKGVGALHPESLAQEVQARGAHYGIALDGDADRLQMVDARGRIYNGDELLYAIVRERMQRQTVEGVVGTLMTNYGFELALQRLGVPFERANVGDRVRAGQPLATIESNLSLTTYTVPAPISGVVLARNASIGTVAGEGAALYEIADLSELWVDLHIFGADAQHITAGVPVLVTRMSDGVTAETTLERVLPGTATASQSTVARATIRNLDGLWRPGSAVKARVTVDHQPVNLVVPLGALQTAGEDDVVYVRRGDTYVTRPVRGGRRDAQRVEIVSGLKAGEQVVVEQSFLVKADIEKSTAEHEH